MLRGAKLYEGRNVVRFVLIALSGLWLSGCSSDASRLTEAMNQPFSNPFAATPSGGSGAAPTPAVTSGPVAAASPAAPNFAYQAPAHPSPPAGAVAAEPAPATTGAIRPPASASVSGGPGGWTAVGGSPVLVLQGDTADSLARRYGVPEQALLGANGLKSASQVHSGMHVIVPVYNAHAVSSNSPNPIPAATEPARKTSAVADAEDGKSSSRKGRTRTETADSQDDAPAKAKGKKHAVEEADATPAKSKKSKAADADSEADSPAKAKGKKHAVEEADASPLKSKKSKADADGEKDLPAKGKGKKGATDSAEASSPKANDKTKADAKTADAKLQETKVPETKSSKPSAEAPKVAIAKPDAKATIDTTPTSRVAPSTPNEPVKTAVEADAAGGNPEFRWPARGRIIQGFKAGGNDGINISVPEGTSVRAAENGVVAYAGSELKGYGNLILIRHPNGFVTAYANNGEIDVKRGDQVKRGQVIAKSGESGNVNAPQLHFELRDKSGQPVDPTSYLAGI
jgi:murein DD-endopeptidase MepM/ murein hydrolase activator NlpD